MPDLDVLKVRLLKTETRVAFTLGLKEKENLTDKRTHQGNEANNSLIWNT